MGQLSHLLQNSEGQKNGQNLFKSRERKEEQQNISSLLDIAIAFMNLLLLQLSVEDLYKIWPVNISSKIEEGTHENVTLSDHRFQVTGCQQRGMSAFQWGIYRMQEETLIKLIRQGYQCASIVKRACSFFRGLTGVQFPGPPVESSQLQYLQLQAL